MLSIVQGDVFSALRPGDIFLHGCNCMGVFGSGIAKAVKNKWPEAYNAYKTSVRGYRLGEYSMIFIPHDNVFVVNALTQQFYGRDKSVVYVNYSAVESIFVKIISLVESFMPNSRIVFPFVGAGTANGNSNTLLSIYERVFENTTVEGLLVVAD